MTEITDALGRSIFFEQPPSRVISLIPSITEALFELGLETSIAGISKFCNHPAEKVKNKPKVGGQKNPDFKKIEALNPDLIILNREENRPEDIEVLSKMYRTWVTYPKTFLDARQLLEDIGKIFKVETGSYTGTIQRDYEKLRFAENPPLKCLYLIWREPWMSINRDTFIHDVLLLHGLMNVCADRDERYPTITMKDVENLNPDVIILPDEPFRFREKHVREFDQVPVAAVTHRRVILADGTYFCWYGTRTARASAYIHQTILNKVYPCA